MPTDPVTVWHLEITDPAGFRPSRKPLGLRLDRITNPTAELARHLYTAVGGPYAWVDRLGWTVEQWTRRYADPHVELWVAGAGDEAAGYFELERRADGTVEISYFGLFPDAVGKGHGGPLLSAAVTRAWEIGASRVYVNTCSLDHPAALGNYQARGFEVVRVESR